MPPKAAPPVFTESSLLSPLSTTEKLILAQAVYQSGTANYPLAVKLLHGHPLLKRGEREDDFFGLEVSRRGGRYGGEAAGKGADDGHAQVVKNLFETMLGEKDIALDPAGTFAANSPPLLKVAKKYYMQRVFHLRELMQLEEDKFRITYSEIVQIKSGAWDDRISDEPLQLSTRPNTPAPSRPSTPAPSRPSTPAPTTSAPAPPKILETPKKEPGTETEVAPTPKSEVVKRGKMGKRSFGGGNKEVVVKPEEADESLEKEKEKADGDVEMAEA
ncbi:hypothetical protein P7C70_g5313, partial [Phenoliferia sp. Uapishka_3]